MAVPPFNSIDQHTNTPFYQCEDWRKVVRGGVLFARCCNPQLDQALAGKSFASGCAARFVEPNSLRSIYYRLYTVAVTQCSFMQFGYNFVKVLKNTF